MILSNIKTIHEKTEENGNKKIIEQKIIENDSDCYFGINNIIPSQEQIDKIKKEYQSILDNLLKTKQHMEMLGQPVDSLIVAYQTKKSEMENAIRQVR